jgi:hypothetical protein
MRKKILDLAYQKGLYAQGTPDSWDEEALFQFGQHLIDLCIDAVEEMDTLKGATTYDQDVIEGAKHHCAQAIERKFK